MSTENQNNQQNQTSTPEEQNSTTTETSINPQKIATKIGEQLKTARIEKNINLDIIADELKIREHHLQNFENGNYKELPETTYAIGFVKSYAQYLNVQTDEIIEEFRSVLNTRGNNNKNIVGIKETPVSRTSLYYIFLGAMTLCFILYVIWINYSQTGSFAWNAELSQIITEIKSQKFS